MTAITIMPIVTFLDIQIGILSSARDRAHALFPHGHKLMGLGLPVMDDTRHSKLTAGHPNILVKNLRQCGAVAAGMTTK